MVSAAFAAAGVGLPLLSSSLLMVVVVVVAVVAVVAVAAVT